jgi:hypothetical protein
MTDEIRLTLLVDLLRAQAEVDHYKRLVKQHPLAPAYLHRLRDAEVRIYELLNLTKGGTRSKSEHFVYMV